MRLRRAGASTARARASTPPAPRRPRASLPQRPPSLGPDHGHPLRHPGGAFTQHALPWLDLAMTPQQALVDTAGFGPESRARTSPGWETYLRVTAEGRSAWLCRVRFCALSLPRRWVGFRLPPEFCGMNIASRVKLLEDTAPAHGICILYPQTRRRCVGLKEKPVRLNDTFPVGSFSFLIVRSHRRLSGNQPAVLPMGKESASATLSPKNLLCKPDFAEACASGDQMGKP